MTEVKEKEKPEESPGSKNKPKRRIRILRTPQTPEITEKSSIEEMVAAVKELGFELQKPYAKYRLYTIWYAAKVKPLKFRPESDAVRRKVLFPKTLIGNLIYDNQLKVSPTSNAGETLVKFFRLFSLDAEFVEPEAKAPLKSGTCAGFQVPPPELPTKQLPAYPVLYTWPDVVALRKKYKVVGEEGGVENPHERINLLLGVVTEFSRDRHPWRGNERKENAPFIMENNLGDVPKEKLLYFQWRPPMFMPFTVADVITAFRETESANPPKKMVMLRGTSGNHGFGFSIRRIMLAGLVKICRERIQDPDPVEHKELLRLVFSFQINKQPKRFKKPKYPEDNSDLFDAVNMGIQIQDPEMIKNYNTFRVEAISEQSRVLEEVTEIPKDIVGVIEEFLAVRLKTA